MPCSAHPLAGGVSPFPGGNLESSGVLESFLSARGTAETKEIVFLSVGDTRDHRRQYKDPALRTISIDFLLNLIANLRRLGIEHFGILTTQPLCRMLQKKHCIDACAWTTLWHDHPGLPSWSLRPGDMFLMWAQQWHYLARAMELGYSVLRADSDVYLAENPFPILNGPLLAPFALIVQQDFGGPLGSRPSCGKIARAHHAPLSTTPSGLGSLPEIGSCGVHRGTSLLNIGLLYARGIRPGSRSGHGALAVINSTWARFLAQISKPRPTVGSGATAQPQQLETLIDQPLMRSVVSDLSVGEPGKPGKAWMVVPGGAEAIYQQQQQPTHAAAHTSAADDPSAAARPSAGCALRDASACARVQAERARTPFLAQIVRAPFSFTSPPRPIPKPDRIALAPDWLFGRGCLLAVRSPLSLLARLDTTTPVRDTKCVVPPAEARLAQPAPGPAAGILVATHFVYSMALKRKRTFRAFGWDASYSRNRTTYPPGACWQRCVIGIPTGALAATAPRGTAPRGSAPRGSAPLQSLSPATHDGRAPAPLLVPFADGVNTTGYVASTLAHTARSNKAMLFSHTFFAQAETFKAVLCALPSGESGPECSCCVGLKSVDASPHAPAAGGSSSMASMETTGGAVLRWNTQRAAKLAQGCSDYQAFWD